MTNFYNNASLKIKGSGVTSESIRLTKGVLQGDVLSPALFTLFISDLEDFLKNKGIRGVSINHKSEILILGYADDLVMLEDSVIDMEKIFKFLYKYCQAYDLEVNITKTKIIEFKRGGHGHKRMNNKKYTGFDYGGGKIEIVKEYVYLGVMFGSSTLFTKAKNEIFKKSKLAINSLLSLIHKSEIDSLSSIDTIFDNLVLNVMMYSAQICGLRYLSEMEKI